MKKKTSKNKSKIWNFKTLFIILAILVTLDLISTFIALQTPMVHEKNALNVWFFNLGWYGWPLDWIFQLLWSAGLVAFIIFIPNLMLRMIKRAKTKSERRFGKVCYVLGMILMVFLFISTCAIKVIAVISNLLLTQGIKIHVPGII